MWFPSPACSCVVSWVKWAAYQTTTLVLTMDSPLTKLSMRALVPVATALSSSWLLRYRRAQKSPTP